MRMVFINFYDAMQHFLAIAWLGGNIFAKLSLTFINNSKRHQFHSQKMSSYNKQTELKSIIFLFANLIIIIVFEGRETV